MKPANTFTFLLFIAVLYFSCRGNNNGATGGGAISDTSSTTHTDSAMSAHSRDPSIAFPQPPVTGSQVDSTRTEDSLKNRR